jgi:hypothetical protein
MVFPLLPGIPRVSTSFRDRRSALGQPDLANRGEWDRKLKSSETDKRRSGRKILKNLRDSKVEEATLFTGLGTSCGEGQGHGVREYMNSLAYVELHREEFANHLSIPAVEL